MNTTTTTTEALAAADWEIFVPTAIEELIAIDEVAGLEQLWFLFAAANGFHAQDWEARNEWLLTAGDFYTV